MAKKRLRIGRKPPLLFGPPFDEELLPDGTIRTSIDFDSVIGQPPDLKDNQARHSRDFRSVRWHGVDDVFTGKQAICVAELYKAWTIGTPDVAAGTLLAECDSDAERLSSVFREQKGRYHLAWGTMIVPSKTRGAFRLTTPE